MGKTTSAKKMTAGQIVAIINNDPNTERDEPLRAKDIKFKAHPKLPGVFAVVHKEDGERGWVIEGDKATESWDQFCSDPEFPVVTVQVNEEGRPYMDVSGPEEDGCEPTFFYCYSNKYTTKFKVGETVYPIHFHPNVPGGWTVVNEAGIREYWQCE